MTPAGSVRRTDAPAERRGAAAWAWRNPPKHALRRAACGEDFGLGGFDVVQYLPRALEKTAAFFGEPQLARGADEQVGGEFVFQPLHGAADGRVGQPEPLCRAAETAAFHHLYEHGQFVRMGFYCCFSWKSVLQLLLFSL